MTADYLIKRMMAFYKVFTISELSNIIGVSQPSISGWKKYNYIKAIANKCKELKIYDEIFNSITVENEKHTYKYENLCAKGVTAEWLLDNDKSHINQTEIIKEVKFKDIFENFLNFYNTNSLKELSEATGIPLTTISSIKQRQSISALKKKCIKLNIYNDVFVISKSNKEKENMNNIFVNDILLEQAKEKASQYGLSINAYLEFLIVKDLK